MSEIRLDGQVAIVTGAGGGLGREHALALAARGAQVVVNDVGGSVNGRGVDGGPAAKVVHEIRDAGGHAVADSHSVATAEGGAAIVETALAEFGRIDILINNAGILRDQSMHKLTDENLSDVFAVHMFGAFNVTRPAWGHMRAQQYGRVVMTSSNSGILGNFGQSNYGAAKMGLWGLTRVLAVEGEPSNIKVNAIAPLARTRMTETILGERSLLLDPRLVSPLVCWLAHRDVTTTGECYTVGGGRVARFFVGMTPGCYTPDLTPEFIADHIDEIAAETGYVVPTGPLDELEGFLAMVRRAG